MRGIDSETGFDFDDTKRHIDAAQISDEDKSKISEANARKVFPGLGAWPADGAGA